MEQLMKQVRSPEQTLYDIKALIFGNEEFHLQYQRTLIFLRHCGARRQRFSYSIGAPGSIYEFGSLIDVCPVCLDYEIKNAHP
jgi:hypothetical protein